MNKRVENPWQFVPARPNPAKGEPMRYQDGTRIRRNDYVYIKGEPGRHVYKVVGFDSERRFLLVMAPGGRQDHVPVNAIERF